MPSRLTQSVKYNFIIISVWVSVNTLLTGNEDPAEEPAVPAGIDPLLMRLISRLNRDQQIELRGYVKRMLDEPVAEGSSEVHVKAAK